MYRDVTQWTAIRRQILQEGVSVRQVARETGISRETIRKMLDHPLPTPCSPRRRQRPKLGPHTATVQKILRENVNLPPPAQVSVKAIYEHIRDQEGFSGSYSAVKNYAQPVIRDRYCSWNLIYDLLISLEKSRQSASFFCCPVLTRLSYPPSVRSNSFAAQLGSRQSLLKSIRESKPGKSRSSGCEQSSTRRSAQRR